LNHKNIFIIYFIIILLTIGCGINKQKETEIKKPNLAPKDLQNINKGLEDILSSIGHLERLDLDLDPGEEAINDIEDDELKDNELEDISAEENEKKEEANVGEDNEDSDGNNENNDNEEATVEKHQSSKEEDQSKTEKADKIWKSIDKEIEDIYSSWYSYEVKGIEKGASSENGRELEVSLNKLTKGIENKNIIEIYDYGSQALKNLTPYYNLYSDEITGDINQIEYFVYQFYINTSSQKENDNLEENLLDEEAISRLRSKLSEDKEKLKALDEIKLSLENINRSLGEDSKRLYIIKKDALIKKIKTLEA